MLFATDLSAIGDAQRPELRLHRAGRLSPATVARELLDLIYCLDTEIDMARIVAARLEHTTDVDSVLRALASQGFQQSEFQSFYVNPRGQHALYTLGGDAYSDEGAKRGGIGALTGAAIGGVIGLGAGFGASIIIDSSLAVLVGGAVGAYVGSLYGALRKFRPGDKRRATVEHPVERSPGQMVAVRVDRPGTEPRAIETLNRFGARDIERTEGKWQAGDWKDFDPRIPRRK